MALTCLSQVALECTSGSSDKLYIIQVQHDDVTGEYLCYGYSGRRGSALLPQSKYKGPSQGSADAAAAKLEKDKRRTGGYTTHVLAAGARPTGLPASAPTFGGASVASATTTPASAPTGPVIVGIKTMQPKPADEPRMLELMDAANWGGQRKYDGERVTVSLRRSKLQAANREGVARVISAGAEAQLKKLLPLIDFSDDRETVFDGELMGDFFMVYDVITLRDADVRKISCEERYYMLEELFKDHTDMLAPMAWTKSEKEAMLAKAQAEGWEGLIFRDLDAGYATGYTDVIVKYKLWASCTCRVLTVNSKRSVEVAVLDGSGNEVSVGNVSIPVNEDIPELDSLIEVRYLYTLPGGSLIQPTYQGVRNDKTEADLRSSLREAPPEKTGELPLAA